MFKRGPDSNYTPGSVPASCYQSGSNSTTSSCSLLLGNSSSTACPGPDEVWSSGCLAASLHTRGGVSSWFFSHFLGLVYTTDSIILLTHMW